MTIAEEALIQEAIKLVEFKGRTRDFPIAPLCDAVRKVKRERKKNHDLL